MEIYIINFNLLQQSKLSLLTLVFCEAFGVPLFDLEKLQRGCDRLNLPVGVTTSLPYRMASRRSWEANEPGRKGGVCEGLWMQWPWMEMLNATHKVHFPGLSQCSSPGWTHRASPVWNCMPSSNTLSRGQVCLFKFMNFSNKDSFYIKSGVKEREEERQERGEILSTGSLPECSNG